MGGSNSHFKDVFGCLACRRWKHPGKEEDLGEPLAARHLARCFFQRRDSKKLFKETEMPSPSQTKTSNERNVLQAYVCTSRAVASSLCVCALWVTCTTYHRYLQQLPFSRKSGPHSASLTASDVPKPLSLPCHQSGRQELWSLRLPGLHPHACFVESITLLCGVLRSSSRSTEVTPVHD